jgi:hypothetical protein
LGREGREFVWIFFVCKFYTSYPVKVTAKRGSMWIVISGAVLRIRESSGKAKITQIDPWIKFAYTRQANISAIIQDAF